MEKRKRQEETEKRQKQKQTSDKSIPYHGNSYLLSPTTKKETLTLLPILLFTLAP